MANASRVYIIYGTKQLRIMNIQRDVFMKLCDQCSQENIPKIMIPYFFCSVQYGNIMGNRGWMVRGGTIFKDHLYIVFIPSLVLSMYTGSMTRNVQTLCECVYPKIAGIEMIFFINVCMEIILYILDDYILLSYFFVVKR